MAQALSLVSLVVRDYDEAIAFYVGILGFTLVQDVYQPDQDKRWVVVRPNGLGAAGAAGLVLGKASTPAQEAVIGNQTGGRVFMFLQTDDFWRDHALYTARGVTFTRSPSVAGYGTVAVFADLYGNLWDLIQPGLTQPLA